jgi:hypothetical protein
MTNNRIASLLALLTTACLGSPVLAQDFLTTQTATPPTFLNNAYSSTGATGNLTNSSGLMTTQQTLNGGVIGGQAQPGLAQAQNALMAPNSVNNAAYPSGSFSYGFAQSNGLFNLNLGSGSNQYGNFGGQALPSTATSSVDLNTVDCPYLRSSGLGGTIIPWSLNISLPGLSGSINLSETAASAESFLSNIGL